MMHFTYFSQIFSCFRHILCVICSLIITGCSQINPFSTDEDESHLCPQLAIHTLAQQNSYFLAGSKKDPVDARFHINFDDIQGECRVNNKTVSFDLTLSFTAQRGRAFEGGLSEFKFVIAWVAPNGAVVFSDVFTHNLEFVENYREVKLTRAYHNVMTIEANEKASDYSLIGALAIDQATLQSRLK